MHGGAFGRQAFRLTAAWAPTAHVARFSSSNRGSSGGVPRLGRPALARPGSRLLGGQGAVPAVRAQRSAVRAVGAPKRRLLVGRSRVGSCPRTSGRGLTVSVPPQL